MGVLVGLIGRKRSGKDTFAARLVDAHAFKRLAFADALKDVVLDVNPFIAATHDVETDTRGIRLSEVVGSHGWEYAKGLPEVRRLLQEFGIAVRRHVGEDVWLSTALANVREDVAIGNVVLTDVRFENEANAIEARGGVLVRVSRTGLTCQDSHVSETTLDKHRTHYHIRNEGDIPDLNRQADSLATLLLAHTL